MGVEGEEIIGDFRITKEAFPDDAGSLPFLVRVTPLIFQTDREGPFPEYFEEFAFKTKMNKRYDALIVYFSKNLKRIYELNKLDEDNFD